LPGPTVDDLAVLNAGPEGEIHRWVRVPRDQWERIEDRVRAATRVRIYFRLSPPELAALRAGQKLKFGYDPRPDDLHGAGARPRFRATVKVTTSGRTIRPPKRVSMSRQRSRISPSRAVSSIASVPE
jgi:hypothetical protein